MPEQNVSLPIDIQTGTQNNGIKQADTQNIDAKQTDTQNNYTKQTDKKSFNTRPKKSAAVFSPTYLFT
jgi:hypothetical protein